MDDEAVANFVAITGGSETVAHQVLEIAGGDLEHAVTLYFDNPGVFSSAAAPSTSSAPVLPEIGRSSAPASSRPPRPSTGRQDPHGVIHIDSDDEDEDVRMDDSDFGFDDVAEAATVARTAQEEEDAAIAKRLQEELYSESSGTADGIRAPIARTTETLLAPSYGLDLDHDAEREAAVMEQLRRRRQVPARGRIRIPRHAAPSMANPFLLQRSDQALLARTPGPAETLCRPARTARLRSRERRGSPICTDRRSN